MIWSCFLDITSQKSETLFFLRYKHTVQPSFTHKMAADEDHFLRRPTAAGRPRPCLHSVGHSRTASEYSSLKAANTTRSKKVSSGLVTERTAASERAAALPPIEGLGLLTEWLRSLDNVMEGEEGSAFVTAPPLTKADARKSTTAPPWEQSLVRQRSAPVEGYFAKAAPQSKRMRSTSIAPEQLRRGATAADDHPRRHSNTAASGASVANARLAEWCHHERNRALGALTLVACAGRPPTELLRERSTTFSTTASVCTPARSDNDHQCGLPGSNAIGALFKAVFLLLSAFATALKVMFEWEIALDCARQPTVDAAKRDLERDLMNANKKLQACTEDLWRCKSALIKAEERLARAQHR